MFRPRRAVLAVVGAVAVGTVTGCSATVSVTPAPEASAPACAEVTVRLPDQVDGQRRVWTDAQSTGAWRDGDGRTTVVLTCGLAAPGPSTLPCQTVDGVDWLVDDAQAPNYRLTTFGREPAAQVYLDSSVVSAGQALADLSVAVGRLPTTGAVCTAPGS